MRFDGDISKNILYTVFQLAHENNITVQTFLEKIDSQFHVCTDNYPVNENGNKVYPDGNVGLDLDITDEEFMTYNLMAAKKGQTLNELFINAVSSYIGANKEKELEAPSE